MYKDFIKMRLISGSLALTQREIFIIFDINNSNMSATDQQVIIGFGIFIVSMIITALIFISDSKKDKV